MPQVPVPQALQEQLVQLVPQEHKEQPVLEPPALREPPVQPDLSEPLAQAGFGEPPA